MPTITRITVPKRSPRKRAIYLDGKWAINLPANLVERRGLVVGFPLTDAELETLKSAEVQQIALDKGLDILSRRLHSESELRTKLTRAGYTPEQIDATTTELTRLGYIDDLRFAKAKATSAAEYRKHGQRRAYTELIKAGVPKETAHRAATEVFESHDSLAVARQLAARKSPSLQKLDPQTARRRLTGLLLRRGFNFEEIKPVLDEFLTAQPNDPEADTDHHASLSTSATPKSRPRPDRDTPKPPNWRTNLLPTYARKKEKPVSSWAPKWSRRTGGKK